MLQTVTLFYIHCGPILICFLCLEIVLNHVFLFFFKGCSSTTLQLNWTGASFQNRIEPKLLRSETLALCYGNPKTPCLLRDNLPNDTLIHCQLHLKTHSVFAYPKRERYYISRLCFETVVFSFGISENTVFSNGIDSVSFGRWTGLKSTD
jgi:hypothetical protein